MPMAIFILVNHWEKNTQDGVGQEERGEATLIIGKECNSQVDERGVEDRRGEKQAPLRGEGRRKQSKKQPGATGA